ncbi:alginate O-acetyltransferase complex protein AlgI [Dysgonomonas alginatilytica]|uniref:Alginate O-acetyltransferase complex protein AlgI n=1 Tax=Dysgonomonas alginatilytica TaxID=1605892 RepID=A0A2V3PP67_9BACT|nr:MBOAT family O-acyltransferase [Dysgonomonas alginatilytica]PXV62796.1 alginate O-acetyltransferase complex protein AlgI [Dysgonomonas alginatilytica]
MLFTSVPFLILFLITFILYYLPKVSKHQVSILVISSLIFYAYDQPWFTLLLLFSAGLNIATSYYVVYGNPQKRKLVATTGVILNVLGLAFFKYSPLISATLFNPESSVGHFLLMIPLPIGISFFTFEGISLLIDVWRDKDADEKAKTFISPSLLQHAQRTLFFISFFPHLIAGPILKAHDFYPQIMDKRFKEINWESAVKNLITGYFLKMVIADNLKNFTFWISYPYFEKYSTIDLSTMLFGYSIQIFADFAGYSLIAIGLAKVFGYDFQTNFNFPYISTSFKEFWKRWHISLSTFLMEYLYFPLGGNRKGKWRTYFNLLLTMVLGGLWHGAGWSYATWGALHGGMLAIERLTNDNIKIKLPRFLLVIKGFFVFTMVTLAWLLFKLPDFSHVIKYFESMANNVFIQSNVKLNMYIILYSIPVIIYHLLYLYRNSKFWFILKKKEYILYAILLFFVITNSGTSGSFIYFQF